MLCATLPLAVVGSDVLVTTTEVEGAATTALASTSFIEAGMTCAKFRIGQGETD